MFWDTLNARTPTASTRQVQSFVEFTKYLKILICVKVFTKIFFLIKRRT